MFWIGLIIGLVVGVIFGAIFIALLTASRDEDNIIAKHHNRHND